MKLSLNLLKSAMNAQTDKHAIVANNLANVGTSGFKKDVAFVDYLSGGRDTKLAVNTDFSQGRLKQTGNPLDLALLNRGFFTVETADGEAYTRNGRFTVGEDGVLRTAIGNPVLGAGGRIDLSSDSDRPPEVTVTNRGEILVDDLLVDILRIVDFQSDDGLRKIGADLFRNAGWTTSDPVVDPMVKQGNLEESNVSPVDEMVGLIELQRRFESSMQAVKAIDAAQGRAVNDIGRVR